MKKISGRTAVLLLAIAAVVSCKAFEKAPETSPTKRQMNELYDSAQRIYSKLWDREKFLDPHERPRIQADLEKLSTGFHRVETDFPIEQFEPGFRVVLKAQQDLLADSAARFREGKKDYVLWRLRGMLGNCVACHSRVGVPIDFAGQDPGPGRGTVDEVLARGEFLEATRQFARARDYLLGIVRGDDGISYDRFTKFEALKLYMVSAVRVKGDYAQAAADLQSLLDAGLVNEDSETIRSWISQLQGLPKFELMPPIPAAEKLLEPVAGGDRIKELAEENVDEANIVQTLAATKILHNLLLTPVTGADARRGQFFLAVAYNHLPLKQFESFSLALLEQTIRDNPGSPEARTAFELLKLRIELDASGPSGSANLEAEDKELLKEMDRLSRGASELVLPDTGVDLNQ